MSEPRQNYNLNFKRVWATIPIDLYEAIRRRGLWHNFDETVTIALKEYIERNYGESDKP